MHAKKSIAVRLLFIAVMALLEAVVIFILIKLFEDNMPIADIILHTASIIILLSIIKRSKHLSFDMMYVVLIMWFPIPATAMYFLLAGNLLTSRTFLSILSWTNSCKKYYLQDSQVIDTLKIEHKEQLGQIHYISHTSGFPVYENTGFDYYGLGDIGYPVLLEELKKAKEFIFLEYFIIEEGVMWNGILEILEKKAKEGVEVRVLYDDVGSLQTLDIRYSKMLNNKGIQCIPFNRINPILGLILNHRDHRKITVIDGKVAFSGGVNLADEYINVIDKYGHWKDNMIRITGEAVWSYTVLFLTHWNALSKKKDFDFTVFKREPIPAAYYDGFIAPYGENPLTNEITAQNIYMNILNQANDYCYIFTPYLIIDSEFINALILAANRGVDVRIMTPGHPDKKIVWNITRSYYESLIEGGVKIIEYTPGFVHSKVFVSDDKVATVGTINLDYRSLYLHFENGTYLYNSKKIYDIKKDFMDAQKIGHVFTLEESHNSFIKEFLLSLARIFAPLL